MAKWVYFKVDRVIPHYRTSTSCYRVDSWYRVEKNTSRPRVQHRSGSLGTWLLSSWAYKGFSVEFFEGKTLVTKEEFKEATRGTIWDYYEVVGSPGDIRRTRKDGTSNEVHLWIGSRWQPCFLTRRTHLSNTRVFRPISVDRIPVNRIPVAAR